MVANEELRLIAAEAITTATVDGLAQAARLGNATAPHEPALRAINDDVARAAGIAIHNAAMRIIRESEAAAGEVAAIAQRARERLATLPDAAFVDLTWRDRLGALMRGTYAELELRPGTPHLTFWQDLKQLVGGGEVEKLCDDYDRQQTATRREELALALAQNLAHLQAQAAAAETAHDEPLDDETVADLLRSVHRQARNGADYVEVER
jgi:hypothetical protein